MASINTINNIIPNNSLYVGNTNNNANSSAVIFTKDRLGGALTTGDNIGALLFFGNEGTGSIYTSAITCTSSGTIALNRIGSDLKFYTHADVAGATSLRMTIADTGAITIATPDSGTALTITGGGATITAGGLTVTAGGVGITAGGLTVTAGGATITAGNFLVTAGTTTLTPLNVAGHVVNSAAGLLSTAATTQFCLQVGNATGAIDSLAVGTAGQLMRSAGAGLNPAWTATTFPATAAKGDILIATAANTITSLAASALSTRYLANTGVDNVPQWDQIGLTTGVTGVLPIANGGTNANAMANTYGVTYFDGTRIVATAVGTATHILTSNGAGVAPTFQAASSGVLPWTYTTISFNADVNNGYIVLVGVAVRVGTLPAVAAQGSVFRFVQSKQSGSAGLRIGQNAGQEVYEATAGATTKTTTGVGGYIQFTYGAVELLCTVANTEFMIISRNCSTITWV